MINDGDLGEGGRRWRRGRRGTGGETKPEDDNSNRPGDGIRERGESDLRPDTTAHRRQTPQRRHIRLAGS